MLTAAHVVGASLSTSPHVVIDGKTLPAVVVRKGTFQGDDLTVLKIDDSGLSLALRLRHITLCQSEPPLGTNVVVVTPEGTARSRLAKPSSISPSVLAQFPTLIDDVATTGNSGSGVFDVKLQCLLGIMSRKISLVGHVLKDGQRINEVRDIAKYFVPFSIIARAIPADVKF